jgi:CubicO group peptidase (beta-lactamase class C family)
MATLPFDAHPGERWVYGYAADILGVVVERTSGLTLDAFLQSKIFGPLKMVDTHFYLPPSKRARLAVVYTLRPDGSLEPAPTPGGMVGQGAYIEGPRRSYSGGAGLLSTAPDYARFLQMLLNGGEIDGVRILSSKSVQVMTTDHLGNVPFRPGEGFGLGFSVVKSVAERGMAGSVGEFGWGGAYRTTYWVDPRERLVVTYFTQLIPLRRFATLSGAGRELMPGPARAEKTSASEVLHESSHDLDRRSPDRRLRGALGGRSRSSRRAPHRRPAGGRARRQHLVRASRRRRRRPREAIRPGGRAQRPIR